MKNNKITTIIEARFGAIRLPGKVMKKIIGKPMLELMIERVKKSVNLNDIIIATSTNAKDRVIEKLADRLKVKCFKGSENDVLDRVVKAAQKYNTDHIVELWGDCPLIDPVIIDDAIEYYLKNNFDLVGTSGAVFGKDNFPLGMSLLIFSATTLKQVATITADPVDRENVSNYIYEHAEKYKLGLLPCPKNLKRLGLRLVVDEEPDFKLITKIFENLYPKKQIFSLADIIRFLDTNPNLKNINKDVKQKKLR